MRLFRVKQSQLGIDIYDYCEELLRPFENQMHPKIVVGSFNGVEITVDGNDSIASLVRFYQMKLLVNTIFERARF